MSFYIRSEIVNNKILELEFQRYEIKDPRGKLVIDGKIAVLKEILKPQRVLTE